MLQSPGSLCPTGTLSHTFVRSQVPNMGLSALPDMYLYDFAAVVQIL